MSTSADPSIRFRSHRIYERLLRAYPEAHRQAYGAAMSQLFRDQCRDAWNEAGRRGLALLWLRVLPDLVSTSIFERLSALGERKIMLTKLAGLLRARQATPALTFLSVFCFVFGLVFLSSVAITFLLPESYAGVARIRVEPDRRETPARPDSTPGQPGNDIRFITYDPYLIQTEFEVIQSEAVLGRVVRSLNLNVEWGKRYFGGSTLKSSEALDLLRRRLEMRPVRNTSLIEICAYSEDAEQAAALANAVVEAYRAYRLERNHDRMTASVKALEAVWQDQDDRFRAAQDRVAKLHAELKVPVPEPSETELLANYRPYAEARQEWETQRQLHLTLTQKRAQEQADLMTPQTAPVEIVEHATATYRPVRPNKPLNIVLGAIIGIFLASMAGLISMFVVSLIGKRVAKAAAAT